ncbi:hypothetical protein [Streptomyces sp. NPDC006355]|uniref:hypothetical protein n=1 Tax=Streptomyces sp. NPDC006355 TaxID=3156758 RepID=UPI0033A79173
MARIRTIKPEAFVSESLAAVSLTAERTFVSTGEQIWGLLNVLPDTFDKIPETLGHGVQEGPSQPHRASSEGA